MEPELRSIARERVTILWAGGKGMTEAGFRAAATQVDEHLHGALPEGGDLYLAWTTLDLLVVAETRSIWLARWDQPKS